MGGSNNGIWNCKITRRSFVDIEEEEHLSWKIRDFQKYWRKCNREKKPYIETEAIKKVCWSQPTEVDEEIAHRVAMYGAEATIDDLHDMIHEHFRNELLNEMINLGWDKRIAKYWIWKDWKMLIEREDKYDNKQC